jgi:hypothetical protein
VLVHAGSSGDYTATRVQGFGERLSWYRDNGFNPRSNNQFHPSGVQRSRITSNNSVTMTYRQLTSNASPWPRTKANI